MNKYAFTLVELIVVVTILGILSTIWFVWYTSYLTSIRDTNRITSLWTISNGFEVYRASKKLPLPDSNVEVHANGKLIAWQWFAGINVLKEIDYGKWWVDPKTGTYFSYYLTKDKKHYQMMAFLEKYENIDSNGELEDISLISENIYAERIDYENTFPKVYWDQLGILTNGVNQPINDIPAVANIWKLDIVTTTDEYRWYLTDYFFISWTGSELQNIANLSLVWWVANSCKSILQSNPRFKGQDGYYYINLELPTKVYCDMTDDGWGWTRYVNIKWNYTFDEAKKCWWWKYQSEEIECFNPNQYNFIVQDYKVTIDNQTYYKRFKTEIPSRIYETNRGSYQCLGGQDYMTLMNSATSYSNYPSILEDNIQWIRLWLNFCDESGREVGWRYLTSFMNYSSTNPPTGPNNLPILWAANRKSSAFPAELYVR